MKKAKQRVKNTSAQVAAARASITVGNTMGPARDAAVQPAAEGQAVGGQPAEGQPAEGQPAEGQPGDGHAVGRVTASPGSGESGDQEDGTSEDASTIQSGLPPIYLALAISINLAADFQKRNSNVIEEE